VLGVGVHTFVPLANPPATSVSLGGKAKLPKIMIHKPLISVVVPAYNEEKYLANCLESLNNQVFPRVNYEVIVVDNNSTDATRQIAEKYGARVVGCQVQGVASARDAGIKAAWGEIIANTDADTTVAPDWLEKIASHFHSDPMLLGLTGPAYLLDTNPINSKISYFTFNLFQIFNFAINKPTFSGFNFAVKIEAYNEVGGINVELPSAEDVDLSFKLTKIGKLKYFTDVVVYTSARRLKKNPFEFFRHNIKNYLSMLTGKEPEPFGPIR